MKKRNYHFKNHSIFKINQFIDQKELFKDFKLL
jgi:hypothetical protein